MAWVGPRLSWFLVITRLPVQRWTGRCVTAFFSRENRGRRFLFEGRKREREKGKAERRERERPVFVEMFSYLRENVQRSRRKGRGNDSWRMKRGRDHGGNLFIEPSRDLSGPGWTDPPVILINSTAGYRTTFPRISWLYTTFSSRLVSVFWYRRRCKGGRGNWVLDGLGEVIGGFELISRWRYCFPIFRFEFE